MDQPIVGFYVKDKLGQNLFGDNTYLTFSGSGFAASPGDRFMAHFTFQMPYLPAGEYSVNVAVANGTQDDHVQHHWLEDALVFRCEGGHVRQGLLGIPMHDIQLKLL